jgi:hypothetical protein
MECFACKFLGLLLADGLQPAAIELQLGLRFIKAIFYETKPWDPKVFVAVAVLLLPSAALACTAPAWAGVSYRPDASLKDGTREH